MAPRRRKLLPAPAVPPATISHALQTGKLHLSRWTRTLTDEGVDEVQLELVRRMRLACERPSTSTPSAQSANTEWTAARMSPSSAREAPTLEDNSVRACRETSGEASVQAMRSMAHVDARGMQFVSSRSFVRLVQCLGGELRELDVSASTCITDAALQMVASLCPHLRELRLDACAALTSLGIAATAEACPELQSLSMNDCLLVNDAALSRIGGCCRNLRTVSLRGCAGISDGGVRMLAAGCAHLQNIDLSAGPAITDAGLASLAAGAVHLQRVCMEAPARAHLVSDGALTLFGTHLHQLAELILTGCDRVTDVGIRWLCSGTPQLKVLVLDGCRRMSDKALALVAASCPQLQHLSLSDCNMISDIGLRHIACGCPQLQEIHLQNLPLLSDGRLSALPVSTRLSGTPIKPHLFKPLALDKRLLAADALSARSEVGMTALALACPLLTCIDVSRCAGVGHNVLRAIRTNCVHGVHTLNLAACKSTTTDALCNLLREIGPTLQHLELRGTAGVTTRVLHTIAVHCTQVSSLSIAECPAVPDDGLKGLMTGCIMLTHLTLADNPQLSDVACYHLSVSRAPAAGAPMAGAGRASAPAHAQPPAACSLRSLSLKGCTIITDSGVGWILQSHPALMSLNVKGTGVSKGSLVAAVHGSEDSARGPISLRCDEMWWGIVPKHRAEDILAERAYERQWQAAGIIQTMWRRVAAGVHTDTMRTHALRKWLAVQLQAMVRGHAARKRARNMLQERQRQYAAATTIAQAWQHYQFRKRCALRVFATVYTHLRANVIKLQRMWRRFYYRSLMQRAVRFATGRRQQAHRGPRTAYLRSHAVLDIQRVWRGYAARQRTIPPLRAAARARREAWYHAASHIVGALRGYRQMRMLRLQLQRKVTAIAQVQRWWRRVVARVQRRIEWSHRHAAATSIQALWRGRAGRRHAADRQLAARLAAMQAAAQTITRFARWGGWMCRLRKSGAQRARMRLATTNIQRCWRGHCGRLQAAAAAAAARAKRARRAALEHWAAARIQALWRRVKAVQDVRNAYLATSTTEGITLGLRSTDIRDELTATRYLSEERRRNVRRDIESAHATQEEEFSASVANAAWRLCTDDATGARYFFNTRTGESAWVAE
ncbi:MAG: hypothetical protein EOO65_00170 [Methanosarcinales archaeon]|nr:MAG: hypothetical protein EOO65_00170 [Methanosarcinales archaeon]